MKTLRDFLKDQQEEALSIDGLISETEAIKATIKWLKLKRLKLKVQFGVAAAEDIAVIDELIEELQQ